MDVVQQDTETGLVVFETAEEHSWVQGLWRFEFRPCKTSSIPVGVKDRKYSPHLKWGLLPIQWGGDASFKGQLYIHTNRGLNHIYQTPKYAYLHWQGGWARCDLSASLQSYEYLLELFSNLSIKTKQTHDKQKKQAETEALLKEIEEQKNIIVNAKDRLHDCIYDISMIIESIEDGDARMRDGLHELQAGLDRMSEYI